MHNNIPTVYLKKNEERRILAGHLWIFSNEIDSQRSPLKQFQPGDLVSVRFRPYFVIDTAKVIQVHFTNSRVKYDLEVQIPWKMFNSPDQGITTTRVYNLDADLLEPA